MSYNTPLLSDIRDIVVHRKERAVQEVDRVQVLTYWRIGKQIYEAELSKKNQTSKKRLLHSLAKHLASECDSRFDEEQLALFLRFYRAFPTTDALPSQLGWSHYQLLIRIESKQLLAYYTNEAVRNGWSSQQLKQKISHQRSSNENRKDAFATDCNVSQYVDDDVLLWNPTTLTFLGLKPKRTYCKKEPKVALTDHLQDFLLGLDSGFTIAGSSVLPLVEDHTFSVDLVCYHRLLRCFVLFKIKLRKLTCRDSEQLRTHINYFDRFKKQDFENPAVGVLLCTDKNNTAVKILLPRGHESIPASKYRLHLPTEQQLLDDLKIAMQILEG